MLLSTVYERGSIKFAQSPGRSVLRRLINHLQFYSAAAACTFQHDWLATATGGELAALRSLTSFKMTCCVPAGFFPFMLNWLALNDIFVWGHVVISHLYCGFARQLSLWR
ncbi:hypothetical protein BDZ89DRAFT_1064685 [Hymenopellis radicata]|nr:hypothetical protein BDZ89DRAFT_1064685 [Hymenopellis radicata]